LSSSHCDARITEAAAKKRIKNEYILYGVDASPPAVLLKIGEPPALPGWLPEFDSSGTMLFFSSACAVVAARLLVLLLLFLLLLRSVAVRPL
jgi:hypothetical protein